jgi:hypothetical protein
MFFFAQWGAVLSVNTAPSITDVMVQPGNSSIIHVMNAGNGWR